MPRLKTMMLFDPVDGSYMGEADTLLGIRRKAAQLELGDETLHERIYTVYPSDDRSTIEAYTVNGDELVLVCQPEDHADVTIVHSTTRLR